jgi:ABC-type sulfate transport system substrate-binding protein
MPREDYCRDAQRLHAKTLYRQIEERVAASSVAFPAFDRSRGH